MKLLAYLLTAAGAAVAAAATAEAGSATATLHVGLEECIAAANIVRAARLNTRLGLIERSAELEGKTKDLMEREFAGDFNCEHLNGADVESVRQEPHTLLSPFVPAAALLQTAAAAAAAVEELFLVFCVHAGQEGAEDMVGFVFKGDNVECLQGMAEAVNKLLTASPEYPPAYNETQTPWNTPETQMAARVLWQSTKLAGCAYTKGCPINCMICRMSDKPETGKYPFTKEVYEALLARRDAGVNVASLTAADIGKPLNSSSGGPWGFAALQCLLLGLLTAVGALGLAL
ncbi:hypothetical protein Efla_002839 [Eimeria flavescens]